MKPSLVKHLRSPHDGRPLRLVVEHAAADGEIERGVLQGEGQAYRIEDGVPVLMDVAEFDADKRQTWDSFDSKWKMSTEYRERTLPHYRQWYLERYGFGSIDRLAAFLADKALILDAGTGHGRDAQMYAENCKAEVIGIDFSYGIRNAFRDLRSQKNLHLAQADMTRLPFANDYFDFIACDQALHHTPDTHTSLIHLSQHLKPGGQIAFYVYRKKAPIREFVDDYIRNQTTRMSVEECMQVSEAITKFGKALSDLKIEFEVPADIDILGIKAGRYNLQRFFYYNLFKSYWNDSIDWESNVITNFDWYHPLHAHRHTADEVRGWCRGLNLDIEHLDVCDAGISVIARKS